jgi:hypothetical protein
MSSENTTVLLIGASLGRAIAGECADLRGGRFAGVSELRSGLALIHPVQ